MQNCVGAQHGTMVNAHWQVHGSKLYLLRHCRSIHWLTTLQFWCSSLTCLSHETWFMHACMWCHAETQDAYSDGSSPHKSVVSDDPEEVFGESIDEDSQSVKPPNVTAPAPSTSGTQGTWQACIDFHRDLTCQACVVASLQPYALIPLPPCPSPCRSFYTPRDQLLQSSPSECACLARSFLHSGSPHNERAV